MLCNSSMANLTGQDVVEEKAEGGDKFLLARFRLGEMVAEVGYETYAISPRDNPYTNATTLVLNGGRKYRFPCEVPQTIWKEANSYTELREVLEEKYHPMIIRPVYVYEHSDISLRVGRNEENPFSVDREWDTALVGFAMITEENYAQVFGTYEAPETDVLLDILSDEVETYDHYVNGDVYRYQVVNPTGDVVDSCGGYFSYEDAVQEAKSALVAAAVTTSDLNVG
jgi:hypothetical protein